MINNMGEDEPANSRLGRFRKPWRSRSTQISLREEARTLDAQIPANNESPAFIPLEHYLKE
jgi:hypothetical protein